MIIALGTRKQVGKDTVGKYLIEKYGFKRLAFADALKEDVQDILDYAGIDYDPADEENKEIFRPMLIAYSELRRHLKPTYWLDKVVEVIDTFPDIDYVVTDMRYPNEADALRDKGAVIVRINRNTGLKAEPTEAVGDLIEPDWEIQNNGTFEELYDKVDTIVRSEGPANEKGDIKTETAMRIPKPQ